jgi:hypothetical protein
MVAYPKKTADFHHANCSIFYGQFSERHEIVNPIGTYLPIRPSAQPKPVEFMSLDNPEYLDQVKKAYPGGVEETISFAFGRSTLYTYTVQPEQVATTYTTSLSTGALLDREHYGLTPQ